MPKPTYESIVLDCAVVLILAQLSRNYPDTLLEEKDIHKLNEGVSRNIWRDGKIMRNPARRSEKIHDEPKLRERWLPLSGRKMKYD